VSPPLLGVAAVVGVVAVVGVFTNNSTLLLPYDEQLFGGINKISFL
jgi:hypothetical protein